MQTRPPVRITGRQFCNAFSGLRIDSKSAFYCLTGARATRLLRMGLLAASTAGDALVVGIGRGAVLWRAGTATTLRGADDERCVAVAISGDGATVATASDTKRLRCWHGDVLSEAEAPRRVSGLCIALLGDGQVLLACCAGELYAFPLPALDKPPRRLLAHTSSVLTGVSYANGLVATADRNEKVRVSQFPRCEEIESFCLGHTDFVSGVEFLSGTRLVSCGGDGYPAGLGRGDRRLRRRAARRRRVHLPRRVDGRRRRRYAILPECACLSICRGRSSRGTAYAGPVSRRRRAAVGPLLPRFVARGPLARGMGGRSPRRVAEADGAA